MRPLWAGHASQHASQIASQQPFGSQPLPLSQHNDTDEGTVTVQTHTVIRALHEHIQIAHREVITHTEGLPIKEACRCLGAYVCVCVRVCVCVYRGSMGWAHFHS